ncbi:sentrin-specific protease 3-like [Clavelina lepadiformis]|uniref:sentrin-specific protease 3-like n=1 Tax=Clavelina lepadiformis TaxID=159417 RepID=UPI0040434535
MIGSFELSNELIMNSGNKLCKKYSPNLKGKQLPQSNIHGRRSLHAQSSTQPDLSHFADGIEGGLKVKSRKNRHKRFGNISPIKSGVQSATSTNGGTSNLVCLEPSSNDSCKMSCTPEYNNQPTDTSNCIKSTENGTSTNQLGNQPKTLAYSVEGDRDRPNTSAGSAHDSIQGETISSHKSESSFMKAFRFLRQELSPKSQKTTNNDDDDLIVVSKVDQNVTFTFWDIKRVVKNIVNNFMMDENYPLENLTALQVARRMNNLYHQDFTPRLKEISQCLQTAKAKLRSSQHDLKEVRPGIRYIDLQTLSPGEWLNDVIINEYLKLLVKEKPSTCYVSSFFYEELRKNYKVTLPQNWEKQSFVLIPICIASHWSLLCARPNRHTIEVYNSMPMTTDEEECVAMILTAVEKEYNEITKAKFSWTISTSPNLPQQQNAYDCGVYVCMFARKILYNLTLLIFPSNVTEFREWLRQELIDNKIKR